MKGAQAIRRALRILHIGVADATDDTSDDAATKLAAIVQQVGDAIDALNLHGGHARGAHQSECTDLTVVAHHQ